MNKKNRMLRAEFPTRPSAYPVFLASLSAPLCFAPVAVSTPIPRVGRKKLDCTKSLIQSLLTSLVESAVRAVRKGSKCGILFRLALRRVCRA